MSKAASAGWIKQFTDFFFKNPCHFTPYSPSSSALWWHLPIRLLTSWLQEGCISSSHHTVPPQYAKQETKGRGQNALFLCPFLFLRKNIFSTHPPLPAPDFHSCLIGQKLIPYPLIRPIIARGNGIVVIGWGQHDLPSGTEHIAQKQIIKRGRVTITNCHNKQDTKGEASGQQYPQAF